MKMILKNCCIQVILKCPISGHGTCLFVVKKTSHNVNVRKNIDLVQFQDEHLLDLHYELIDLQYKNFLEFLSEIVLFII